ncbi:MAG: EAL domain-containing protein [Magnetospirillum sp.]|nr:EAL domain-containing protein [Magnetospirillum sp.]
MHAPATADCLLVVDVRAVARLDEVMGARVIDAALGELAERLPALLGGVLAQARDHSLLAASRRGRWCVRFRWDQKPLAESLDEALGVVEAAAQRLVGDLAVEVFGGATGPWAQLVARALLLPPDCSDLDAWVDGHMAEAGSRLDELAELRRRLEAIIAQGAIRTMLQPIVAFSDGAVLGFEALSRGPAGTDLERADHLFSAAARTGLSLDLERACAVQAVQWADRLPPNLFLSINASVPLLMDDQVRTRLARPRVVAEITEHLPIDGASGLLPALAELKAGGAGIALDDTGCGFADVAAAEIIRPDIVKLCITVIRGVRRNPSILPGLCQTVGRFRALGAQVLAEGVETDEERRVLASAEIDLAQGWLFGRPFPAEEWQHHAAF